MKAATIRRGRQRLIAVLLALAMIATACGGSDDDTADGGDVAAPAATEAPEPTPEPVASDDQGADAADDTSAGDDAGSSDTAGGDGDGDGGAEPADAAAVPDDADTESAGDGPPALGQSGPADDSLEPVRIGLLNQENDPIGSFPEIRLGIEGAAAYLNATDGGINGHPIEIVSCTQNSVEKAQECAQELASDDLVSVINGVNIWTVAFDFYGTMGDTPVVGGLPLFASDYNQQNARYFNGGSISVYAAMALFAATEMGASSVSVLLNQNPAADAALDLGLAPIFQKYGIEYSVINVPLPLTDAIPPVSQAAAEDNDVVMLLAAAGECVPVARAADQLGIPSERMLYSATCADENVYAEVGDLLVGSTMARGGFVKEDGNWAPAEVIELLDQFEVDIEVYAPDAPEAAFTGLGWATLIDIHDLYEEIGVENLNDPAAIFAVMDDGTSRGRPGGYGWACVYAEIGLASVCQGENLFVEIIDSDGFSAPPPNDGAYVNGLFELE